MVLRGIPFLGEHNTAKRKSVIKRNIDENIDISLFSLYDNIKEKDNIVIIDNKYITWLEDTYFDYVNKRARLYYFAYETKSMHLDGIKKNAKYIEHIDRDKESGNILLKYNYEMKYIDLKPNVELQVYNISSKKKIKYNIVSWIDTNFSIDTLYKYYEQYCYYDANLSGVRHDSGYTYISKKVRGFINKEDYIREDYGIPTYKNEESRLTAVSDKYYNDYTDVRVYTYFDYLTKIAGKPELLVQKTFRYRKLQFESYLFCSLRSNKKPIDFDDWDKLGSKVYYLKFNYDAVPFFVKHEWLDNTSLVNNKTWRKLKYAR